MGLPRFCGVACVYTVHPMHDSERRRSPCASSPTGINVAPVRHPAAQRRLDFLGDVKASGLRRDSFYDMKAVVQTQTLTAGLEKPAGHIRLTDTLTFGVKLKIVL